MRRGLTSRRTGRNTSVKRRSDCASVAMLPEIIAEIDAMDSKPTAKQRRELIARYRTEGDKHHGQRVGPVARSMINENLIDVLLRTRKWREVEDE